MFILPNGKPIDIDMVELAMEDADETHLYCLNTETGEVSFYSEFDVLSDERERLSEEFERDEYISVERISSHEAYQWMEDFVEQVVAPKDRHVAEKLSIALMGKGAFRRFKGVLNSVGSEWVQTWYQYKNEQLYKSMKEWFDSLPLTITEQ
jgi:hypothetical protein